MKVLEGDPFLVPRVVHPPKTKRRFFCMFFEKWKIICRCLLDAVGVSRIECPCKCTGQTGGKERNMKKVYMKVTLYRGVCADTIVDKKSPARLEHQY
jgi:hypothetical protein